MENQGRGGVCPTKKSFRVVPCRACVRERGLVAEWNWIAKRAPSFSHFPLWGAEFYLFPFLGDKLSLFPSPHPQTSYPFLVVLIGIRRQISSDSSELFQMQPLLTTFSRHLLANLEGICFGV